MKFSKKIVRLVWGLLWLFSITMVVVWGLRLIYGDLWLPARYFNYFLPWLALLTLLGIIVSAIGHRRILAGVLTTFFLISAFPYFPLFLPQLDPPPHDAASLKVMSYSVMGRNKDYEAMAEVIKREKPDLLFLQEVAAENLQQGLAGMYGAGELYFTEGGGGMVSRYPLELLDSASPFAKVGVNTPFGRLTVWNIHTTKAIKNYLPQKKQVKALITEVSTTEGPVIVAGDFNATEQSDTYRRLREQLGNAHEQAGWGFGFTFPTPARGIGKVMPFIRIDHIFFSHHFQATEAKVLKESGGSDHRPITATLKLLW
ncbi:MAG: endonuclease/exonuclease/phosphatase family protein [Desulfobulbaceae bacterium]|nr:endonuclease/exonuclease/phosphatase family protein [Desulfobulbaceae bacterium]